MKKIWQHFVNFGHFYKLFYDFKLLLIYLAFDRLFSHCGGQNSNKNPLEELNIALFKQIFGWRNFGYFSVFFGEIS